MIGGIDEPGREEKVPVTLPARFETTRLPAGETLWQWLLEGKLDAIIAAARAEGLRRRASGDPAVVSGCSGG